MQEGASRRPVLQCMYGFKFEVGGLVGVCNVMPVVWVYVYVAVVCGCKSQLGFEVLRFDSGSSLLLCRLCGGCGV